MTPPYAIVDVMIRIESYTAHSLLGYIPSGDVGLDGATAPNDLRAAAVDLMANEFVACLSDECSLYDLGVEVHTDEDVRYSTAAPLETAGGIAFPPLPNQDAVVFIKHLPALNGRLSRGRMFLSGVPETSFDDNAADNSIALALGALAEVLGVSIPFGEGEMLPAVWSPTGNLWRQFTLVNFTPEIRTQRRRRPLS